MLRSRFIVIVVSLSAIHFSCSGEQKPVTSGTTSGTAAPAETAAAPPAVLARWTVMVCSSVKGSFTLQAGPSKDDNDVFATWKQGDGEKIYDLPARTQNLNQIHLKATSADDGHTALCVRYDGHGKKAYNFDRKTEEHDVNASDADDKDCRCR